MIVELVAVQVTNGKYTLFRLEGQYGPYAVVDLKSLYELRKYNIKVKGIALSKKDLGPVRIISKKVKKVDYLEKPLFNLLSVGADETGRIKYIQMINDDFAY